PAESEALTRSRQELVRAAESQQAVVANGRAAPVQLGLFVEGDAARIDSLLADVKSQRALFDVAWAKRAAADYAPANEPATDGRLAAESYYLFTQAVQYFGRWGMNPAPAAEPRPGAALAGPLPAAGVDGSNLPPGDVPPPAAAAPGEPAAASAMAADSTTAGTRPLGDERPLSAGVVAGEGATAGTAGAPALDAPASLSAAAEAKAPGPVGVAGTTQTFQGGADRRDSATPVQTGWDAAGGTASVVQVTPNSDGLSVYFAWFDVDESKQLKADGENAPGAPQTNLGLAATAPNATRYRLTFDDAINDPAADDATRLGTAATPAQSQPASERGKADERAAAGKPTDDAQRSLEGMPQSDAPARGARPGDKNPAAGGDEKPAQDQKAQPTDREGFSKESGKKPANDEKPVNAARREVMPADLDGAAGRSGDEPNLDEQVAPGSLRKMQEKGKPGSLPTTGLAEVRDEETIPARRRVLFLLKLNAPPAAPANPVPAAPAPAAPAKR
ncbi:MAG TPA: hypothetical protein VGE52_05530, partial [Pirellulales bacterium]